MPGVRGPGVMLGVRGPGSGGKSDSLTAVKLLSCFDDLVAVGTASGRVAVFQLVSPLPGRNKQGECRPVLVLEESSAVVQIQYRSQVLLVSTLHRTLLHHQNQDPRTLQSPDQNHSQNQVQTSQNPATKTIGTQPRKSSGRFGACFLPSLCKQSDLQVFAARPGLRLWRSNVEGEVQETRLLKGLFSHKVPQVALFPRPSPSGGCSPSERQLGALCCFHQNWLLSWNEYSLYVLDYSTQIFLLKGDRDIIRLSTTPEGVPHSE
ncbi:hypothetical protein NL108_015372 [Boleophthalmus pectinirostris]|nr:hypothetical protein NL108_015372 [Boleophthalmus pectinirostris]